MITIGVVTSRPTSIILNRDVITTIILRIKGIYGVLRNIIVSPSTGTNIGGQSRNFLPWASNPARCKAAPISAHLGQIGSAINQN